MHHVVHSRSGRRVGNRDDPQNLRISQLRAAAARTADAKQAPRLLAIAMGLDGPSRLVAAQAGGAERQTPRDFVHRSNADGLTPAALSARRQPGMLVLRACRKSARMPPPHRERRHGTQLLIAIWRYATDGIIRSTNLLPITKPPAIAARSRTNSVSSKTRLPPALMP